MIESNKSIERRMHTGFFERFMRGRVLDIGFRGELGDTAQAMDGTIGIDLDYPGYDGVHLPFEAQTFDAVYSSHCLEHIADPITALREQYRVTRTDGHIIVIVPHQYLYEKRRELPSRYNGDHKRFYTPSSLLHEIETALPANWYRVRHLADNDDGFDYSIPPEQHSGGCYEIECVIQRIVPPDWILA